MRKRTVWAGALVLALGIGLAGPAAAQKLQAPKGVWKAMLAGLGDIQGVTGALMVFDMERAAAIADGLARRETAISQMQRLPRPVRDGHGKVAAAARELAAAARAGEEQEMVRKLADVVSACTACHYDLRDKKRRAKLQ